MIKKLSVLFLGVLCLTASGARAQGNKDLTYGPYFMAGASVPAGTVADGFKVSSRFAWSFGFIAWNALNKNFALGSALGVDSRGFNYHDQLRDTVGYDYRIAYLTFTPQLRISGFVVGIGLGYPVYAGQTSTLSNASSSSDPTLETSDLKFMAELRLGGDIELYRSKHGNEFRLMIMAGYPLTPIANEGFGKLPPPGKSVSLSASQNNGPLATAQIGLSYRFDMSRRTAVMEQD